MTLFALVLVVSGLVVWPIMPQKTKLSQSNLSSHTVVHVMRIASVRKEYMWRLSLSFHSFIFSIAVYLVLPFEIDLKSKLISYHNCRTT